MTDESIRDWRVSEALDKLTPIFEQFNLSESEIQQKAELVGMPSYAMWTAYHLYAYIKERDGQKPRPLPTATTGYY